MGKKYTLYFNLINKYGHSYNLPLLSLDIKSMDIYTSGYKNYSELFNCLPNKINSFIRENIKEDVELNSNDDLEKLFFITDSDFKPMMNVLFQNDIDALYIENKEIEEFLINKVMTFDEFQKAMLKTNCISDLKDRYNFFKYLYNSYVKNKKISCMIDSYDVKKSMFLHNESNYLIASLATNKENLIILSKKLSQTIETRRCLALDIKKYFNNEKLISDKKIKTRIKMIDTNDVLTNMNNDFEKFKSKYDKEYKMNL